MGDDFIKHEETGTSDGARKGWDTRGRGNKTPTGYNDSQYQKNKKESPNLNPNVWDKPTFQGKGQYVKDEEEPNVEIRNQNKRMADHPAWTGLDNKGVDTDMVNLVSSMPDHRVWNLGNSPDGAIFRQVTDSIV